MATSEPDAVTSALAAERVEHALIGAVASGKAGHVRVEGRLQPRE